MFILLDVKGKITDIYCVTEVMNRIEAVHVDNISCIIAENSWVNFCSILKNHESLTLEIFKF